MPCRHRIVTTRGVSTYRELVSRWQSDARGRLERAALELFVEQGFAATTVPQITARAGLTTRTFFRHFADKREVLFGGDEVPAYATGLMREAPASLDPITLVVQGLRTVAQNRFEGRADELRVRRDIICSDAGLRERDLRKRAALADAIRQGFLDRGIDAPTGTLAAELSVSVLHIALEQWLDQDGDRPLFDFVLDTLKALQDLLTAVPSTQTRNAS